MMTAPDRKERDEDAGSHARPESADADPDAGGLKARDLIGQNLRKVYDEVASEPLPDHLANLLERLKKGENR